MSFKSFDVSCFQWKYSFRLCEIDQILVYIYLNNLKFIFLRIIETILWFAIQNPLHTLMIMEHSSLFHCLCSRMSSRLSMFNFILLWSKFWTCFLCCGAGKHYFETYFRISVPQESLINQLLLFVRANDATKHISPGIWGRKKIVALLSNIVIP